MSQTSTPKLEPRRRIPLRDEEFRGDSALGSCDVQDRLAVIPFGDLDYVSFSCNSYQGRAANIKKAKNPVLLYQEWRKPFKWIRAGKKLHPMLGYAMFNFLQGHSTWPASDSPDKCTNLATKKVRAALANTSQFAYLRLKT